MSTSFYNLPLLVLAHFFRPHLLHCLLINQSISHLLLQSLRLPSSDLLALQQWLMLYHWQYLHDHPHVLIIQDDQETRRSKLHWLGMLCQEIYFDPILFHESIHYLDVLLQSLAHVAIPLPMNLQTLNRLHIKIDHTLESAHAHLQILDTR